MADEKDEASPLLRALLSSLGDNDRGKAILSEVLAEVILDRKEVSNIKFTGEPPAVMLENISTIRDKLKETEAAHAVAEKRLTKHDWLDWYAAYMTNRSSGLGIMSSSLTADMYVNWLMEKVTKAEETKKEDK